MLELLKKLEELRCSFLNRDHEVLDLAERAGPDMLQAIAGCFIGCAQSVDGLVKAHSYKLGEAERKEFEEFCKNKKEEIGEVEEDLVEKEVTPTDLDAVAALAEEFSKSGDALLRRQASVLDQVLLTFAVPEVRMEEKKAYDEKIAQIKENLKKTPSEKKAKVSFDPKQVADVVDKNVKKYNPLEAPLKTRNCIDHPGHHLIRVSDDVYQCSLDYKEYNFKSGYTTLSGNQVPGGDVALQSQVPSYSNVRMSFNPEK
jgi:hypothetical protein